MLLKQRRRPIQGQLDRLIATFEPNPRQQIPLGSILRFAVATAMRQNEISRIEWADLTHGSTQGMLVLDRTRPIS